MSKAKTPYYKTVIFDNADKSLLRLDISALGIKLYNLESKKFNLYLKNTRKKNLLTYDVETYGKFVSDQSGYHPYRIIAVPINANYPPEEKVFRMIEILMLLLSPSDFRLYAIVSHDVESDYEIRTTAWSKWDIHTHFWLRPENEIHPRMFKVSGKLKKRVEYFLTSFANLDLSKNYLRIAITSYWEGYHQASPEMAFLNYIMALESLVGTNNEMTDKISRICAVVNAVDKEDGHRIYKNVKELYGFRSQIVHGRPYDYKKIAVYFPYLQALVSSTLIELLSLKITTQNELLALVNESAYGESNKWPKEYNPKRFKSEIHDLIHTSIK